MAQCQAELRRAGRWAVMPRNLAVALPNTNVGEVSLYFPAGAI